MYALYSAAMISLRRCRSLHAGRQALYKYLLLNPSRTTQLLVSGSSYSASSHSFFSHSDDGKSPIQQRLGTIMSYEKTLKIILTFSCINHILQSRYSYHPKECLAGNYMYRRCLITKRTWQNSLELASSNHPWPSWADIYPYILLLDL